MKYVVELLHLAFLHQVAIQNHAQIMRVAGQKNAQRRDQAKQESNSQDYPGFSCAQIEQPRARQKEIERRCPAPVLLRWFCRFDGFEF